ALNAKVANQSQQRGEANPQRKVHVTHRAPPSEARRNSIPEPGTAQTLRQPHLSSEKSSPISCPDFHVTSQRCVIEPAHPNGPGGNAGRMCVKTRKEFGMSNPVATDKTI